MKRILKGIFLFLLPLMLTLFFLKRAFLLVRGLVQPMKSFLPEGSILGIGFLSLLSIAVILLICYFAGMWAERKHIKSFLPFLENNLFVFIPGYTMIKSRAYEAIDETDESWKSVLIGDNEDWKYGIEVDRNSDSYSTVFFPEPPDAKSGELRLIHFLTE